MNLLLYLFSSFFFSLLLFFRHWFIGGTRLILHLTLNFISSLDRFFALKINLRHLFSPLYQDYSLVGYLLGPITRLGLISVSLFIYGLIFILTFLIIFFWLSLPLVIIFNSLPLFT